MEQRQLGRSGLRVSRLGLGTLGWGTVVDEVDACEQLRAFTDAGGTLVDTAAGYGEGASEQTLGRLISADHSREDLVIATKAGIGSRGGVRVVDSSRGRLLDQLDGSLRRLGMDHVDLWQVHVWDPLTPIDETLSALDHAVASGRVRQVGISNFNGWQTALAATHQDADVAGRVRLVSTQMEYSLLQRGIEREVVGAAQALGIGILPWSPLGRGVLTGKYRTGVPADSRAAGPWSQLVEPFLDPVSSRIVEAVVKAGEGLEMSPAEVALAWVRDRPGVVAPILGARTAAQLSGTLTVEEVDLPAEIARALDDVSAITLGYPEFDE